MGKILENGSVKSSFNNDEPVSKQLPIPLAYREEFLEKLRGYNIAIYDGKIVALDKSLRQLYQTLKTLIPEGEKCEIEYIEEGASIYGFNF